MNCILIPNKYKPIEETRSALKIPIAGFQDVVWMFIESIILIY